MQEKLKDFACQAICFDGRQLFAADNELYVFYNSDTSGLLYQEEFITELELIQSETLENGLSVEGEYVSEAGMEQWGWSKYLGDDFVLTPRSENTDE